VELGIGLTSIIAGHGMPERAKHGSYSEIGSLWSAAGGQQGDWFGTKHTRTCWAVDGGAEKSTGRPRRSKRGIGDTAFPAVARREGRGGVPEGRVAQHPLREAKGRRRLPGKIQGPGQKNERCVRIDGDDVAYAAAGKQGDGRGVAVASKLLLRWKGKDGKSANASLQNREPTCTTQHFNGRGALTSKRG
jgi:hypothetical protein